MFVLANKTNVYKMIVSDYKQHLYDNITNTYRKTDPKTVQNINDEAKVIAPN